MVSVGTLYKLTQSAHMIWHRLYNLHCLPFLPQYCILFDAGYVYKVINLISRKEHPVLVSIIWVAHGPCHLYLFLGLHGQPSPTFLYMSDCNFWFLGIQLWFFGISCWYRFAMCIMDLMLKICLITTLSYLVNPFIHVGYRHQFRISFDCFSINCNMAQQFSYLQPNF